VKYNWINFIIFVYNWKNWKKSIVGGIYLHNELRIRNPVDKNECRGEYLLKWVENIIVKIIKLLRYILLSKTSNSSDITIYDVKERADNVQEV